MLSRQGHDHVLQNKKTEWPVAVKPQKNKRRKIDFKRLTFFPCEIPSAGQEICVTWSGYGTWQRATAGTARKIDLLLHK